LQAATPEEAAGTSTGVYSGLLHTLPNFRLDSLPRPCQKPTLIFSAFRLYIYTIYLDLKIAKQNTIQLSAMLSTKEEIKSALEAYCSHIAATNRRVLEAFIPVMVNWVPNEDWELAEDEIPATRLKSLSHLVGFPDVVGQLSDPTDLLTRWEELVPLLELDGVRRLRVSREEEDERGRKYLVSSDVLADQEDRALQFDEYVTAIEAALRERALEEVRGTIAFPEELRILFELGVDGLLGSDLEKYRDMWGCTFWVGPGQEFVEKVVSRVGGPDDNMLKDPKYCMTLRDMSSLEEGWVVAGGWDTGCTLDAIWCCAVFCRRTDEEEFAWRYTITCESDARVFDTIPQLLDYYKDFGQTNMDQLIADANEECLFWGSDF
jgi:hypothetical protein